MNPLLFLNMILLGGTTPQKIAAARAAGFDQIELWRQNVDADAGKPGDVRSVLQREGMGLADFQVLMDFDGAPGARRETKRAEALQMLDMAVQLGADTVLTPASTDAACDATRIVDDLRWLAQEAAARQLRIAYEAMAWSTVNHTTPAAWRCVQQTGAPNLGMVIDAFHIFVRERDVSDLDGIPVERIYLVQLSDLDHPVDAGAVIDTARHRRLLPGAGHFPLNDLIQRLDAMHYTGPIGLEVFNDTMQARDPDTVAMEAMAALRAVLTRARQAPAT